MNCCNYHSEIRALSLRKVNLPCIICLKYGTSKISALYQNEYKIVFKGKTCNSLMSATNYAYNNLLGVKIPKNIRDIDVWCIFFEGKDVPISKFYNGAFINTLNPLKCEYDLQICSEETILLSNKALVTNDQPFKKVTLKFNKNPSKTDFVCFEQKKRKASLNCTKKSKEAKDENMFIEEEEDIDWDPSKNIWTSNDLDYYLGQHPEKAPTLLKIIDEYRANSVPKHMCNPIYRCIFQHPITGEEKDICLGRPILKRISQYKNVLESFENK